PTIAAAAPPGSGASVDEGGSPDPALGVAPSTTADITHSGPVAVDELVSAARVEHGRRQPLGFGALSPIGEGWLHWLLSVLLVMTVVSGGFAVAWCCWLRDTRARQWLMRWMQQMGAIRSHAWPPR